MQLDENATVSNDPSCEAKPDSMNRPLPQAPANARAPAAAAAQKGRQKMFRGD